MAQTLFYPQRLRGAARPIRFPARPRPGEDPAAAARGILLALALSCIAWVALAVTVPLLW
jgi:hypothetical protein